MGYYGGTLAAHNHSATPGDGGQLSSPTIAGTVTVTAQPTATLQLSTLEIALAAALLGA
jgi:hypothetical protein